MRSGALGAAEELLAQSHDDDEERRHHDLVHDHRAQHSAEHDGADRATTLRARATRDHQRQDAEDEREAGHEDRSQTKLRRIHRRIKHRFARVIPIGRELGDHDRVLRRQTNQHDQADLCVGVERTMRDFESDERAEHAERHREQHIERQRPRLVLR